MCICNIGKKILFWLENSRWYALPMTIMSWFVAYSYGLTQGGDWLYGIIALSGLVFAHLAANLFDDFIDYKLLSKSKEGNRVILCNSQNGKCGFILNNQATLKETLSVIVLYCFIAVSVGLFLYIMRGVGVLWYAISGAFVVMAYPFISRFGEVVLALTYGPLIFGGIYYVMTQQYNVDILLLSLAPALLTVGLLYIHTILDYDIDLRENKRTLANWFSTKEAALRMWVVFVFIAYFMVLLAVIFDICNWKVMLTFLTIPLATDLYRSMRAFIDDNHNIPILKWYNFPFENSKNLIEENTASFMFRMYQARNLMLYFSLIYGMTILAD